MTPAEFAAVSEHFEAACDLTPAAQRAYLLDLQQTAPAIAAIVADMLAADLADADPVEAAGIERAAHALLAPEPRVIAGRYEIGECLGMGGGGAVYRGVDRQTRRTIAIKRLHRLADDAHAALRFDRECRALARLQHPGVVAAIDAGVDDGQPYLVCEFVAGGDLSRLVGAPHDVLLAVLVELVEALDYVHGQGIVHRDLKPANVLLTTDEPPRPRLADFGIARASEGVARLTAGGSVVGTPDYLAPEQLVDGPIDARADLWALGALIHVLFAGRPPFDDGPTLDRLQARLSAPAPDLTRRVDHLPAGLAELTAALLQRAPVERPQSALTVAHALRGMLRARGRADLLRGALRRQRGFVYAPRIIDRPAISTWLATAHADALRTGPTRITVSGPAEHGKATLVRRWAAALATRVIEVQTTNASLSPLTDLVAALADTPDWSAPAEVLGGRLADACASSAPLTVIIIDAHRMAPRARDIVDACIDALHARPVAWISTALPAARPFPGVEYAVPPLGVADVRALTASMLGVGDRALPDGLDEAIMQATGGIPGWVVTVVEGLVDAGTLTRIEGGWRFAGGVVTDPLGAHLDARIARLPSDVQAVLAEIALLGPVAAIDDIVACLERPDPTVHDAIAAAARARLVEESGLQIRFLQGAVVGRLAARVPTAVSVRIHDAWSRRLAERAAPASVVARHAVQSADVPWARRWVDAAVAAALRVHAHAAAREILDAACRRWPSDHALSTALLDAQLALGDGPAARAGADELLATEHAPIRRADLLHKRAQARLFADDVLGGLEDLRLALEATGQTVARTRLGRLLQAGWRTVLGRWRGWRGPVRQTERAAIQVAVHRTLALVCRWVDLERTGAHVVAQLEAAERWGAPVALADAYASMASMLSMTGLQRAVRRYQRRVHAAGDQSAIAWMQFLDAGVTVFTRVDWAPALTDFESAIAGARRLGDRLLEVLASGARGWTGMLMGDWAQARADLAHATTVADRLGWGWLSTDATLAWAVLSLAQGDLGVAQATADRVLAGPALPAHRALATELRAGVAFVHGEWTAALADFVAAEALYRIHHLERGWGFLIDVEIAEAALWATDAGASVALLPTLRRCVARSRRRMEGMPFLEGYHAALKGVLAARRGRRAQAERWFARARAIRSDVNAYTDQWIAMRIAVERRTLGVTDDVAAVAAEIDASFAAAQLHGMRRWLREARAVLDAGQG